MQKENITHRICKDEPAGQVIVLNTSRGVVAISTQQIVRIQAISNYSKLFFKDGKTLVVAKVLHWFHEQNCFSSFIRIHRSHLVNLDYIQSYSGRKNGFLYLHNNEMFAVAKRKKKALAKQLNSIHIFNEELAVTGQFSKKEILAA